MIGLDLKSWNYDLWENFLASAFMAITQGLVVDSRRKLKASEGWSSNQSLVIAQFKFRIQKQKIEKRLTQHQQLN